MKLTSKNHSSKALFIALFLCSFSAFTQQIIFNETFNEANSSTSGSDNFGVSWNTSCPGCVSGDYWYVKNGLLEGNDTNGEAEWESGSIDISGYSHVEVSFDVAEIGTMEACNTGCNSGDWVRFQYRIDGGSWQNPDNSFYCSGACAGVNVIISDDIAGGSTSYSSGLIVGGNSLQIRIGVQCWAGTEYWQIDNIVVKASVELPVELLTFEVEEQKNEGVLLRWETASESNSDFYTIERSVDGISWTEITQIEAQENSSTQTQYTAYDKNPLTGLSYYRLKQTDLNGTERHFPIESINIETTPEKIRLYPNPTSGILHLEGQNLDKAIIRILDNRGKEMGRPEDHIQLLSEQKVTLDLNSLEAGSYLVQVILPEKILLTPFMKL
ncbi:MAG: T9SS type A sorting domain-containing protein [Bacteroidetes bacterium]|nr:MAG: T9SS type A sorting domain-containing protein [Bacteroidota bacterium]